MMTTGQIDDDNGTHGWLQPDVLMSGHIDDENGTISWWRGDKFMMTTGWLMSGKIDNEERMPWQWWGGKLTMMTGWIDNGKGTMTLMRGFSIAIMLIVMVMIEMVLDHDGAWSWSLWLQWCSVAMVLDCNGAQSQWCYITMMCYIAMCLTTSWAFV